VWPISWLLRRLRRAPPERRAAALLAPWLPVGAAALGASFAAGLTAIIVLAGLSGSDLSLLIGVPRAWSWLFLIPYLICLLAAAMVACTALAWRGRYWGMGRRVYYTLLAVAAVFVSAVLLVSGMAGAPIGR
jgi:hypothetical protein